MGDIIPISKKKKMRTKKQYVIFEARFNAALLRSSGSLGSANLLWSNPSVDIKSTPELGSADSACNFQINRPIAILAV